MALIDNKNTTLAVKYRPRTFDDLVEQNEIKTILLNQVKSNNLKHAYLFCGGAGTGKTTSCRIIANMINEGKGRPIELDCASHNGVEDMRAIQDECLKRPLDCKYKIFILDECFTGDTKVSTLFGTKPIKDIVIGEKIYSSQGIDIVRGVSKKLVSNDRLIDIYLSDTTKIVTTVDHLFMTTNGWVPANLLQEGDELIVQSEMFKLWSRYDYTQKRQEVLQQQMSVSLSESTQEKDGVLEELRDLWKKYDKYEYEFTLNLFKELLQYTYFEIKEDYNEFRVRYGTKEIIFSKNEGKQPFIQRSNEREDISYYEGKGLWIQGSRGKWEIYTSAIDALQRIRRCFVGIGIGNTNTDKAKIQSDEISYSIQSRPWLHFIQDCDRGGWQEPLYERWYCDRYKEANKVKRVRVEGTTLHKSGNRGEFDGCCDGYTEMYDLELECSPTYFVNNVLVHNCHMLTQQAWNSALKILEEPPEYVIFLFATTDPQKIIQTIMSRVQRFNFKRISTQGIVNRLKYILAQENITTYTDDAIQYIARLARGGMRDSITTLEKCLDYSKDLTLDVVLKVTSGGVNETDLLKLLQQILCGQCRDALLTFNEIYMSGLDVSLFFKMFFEFIENCVKYLITRNSDIVAITDVTAEWLLNNASCVNVLKDYLFHLVNFNTSLSNDDLKIMIESWIIKRCS